MNATQDAPADGAGSGKKTSERRAAANRANAQKSTGPRSGPGLERVSRIFPPSNRLLGLAEARILNRSLGPPSCFIAS